MLNPLEQSLGERATFIGGLDSGAKRYSAQSR